jgi:hypothetical protein
MATERANPADHPQPPPPSQEESQAAGAFVKKLQLAGGLGAAAVTALAGGFVWGTKRKKVRKNLPMRSRPQRAHC